MNPEWLNREETQDRYLFTLSDGKVLHKDRVIKILRAAAIRRGLDPSILASHSLRAGGCTALHAAKRPDHVIMRRGRWVSNCWKIYTWPMRSEDDDLANDMAKASTDLFAHLRSSTAGG